MEETEKASTWMVQRRHGWCRTGSGPDGDCERPAGLPADGEPATKGLRLEPGLACSAKHDGTTPTEGGDEFGKKEGQELDGHLLRASWAAGICGGYQSGSRKRQAQRLGLLRKIGACGVDRSQPVGDCDTLASIDCDEGPRARDARGRWT